MFVVLHVIFWPGAFKGAIAPRLEKEVLALDGHERVERLDASESAAERDREQPPTDGYNSNHDDSRRRQRRGSDASYLSAAPGVALRAVGGGLTPQSNHSRSFQNGFAKSIGNE